MVKRSEPDLDAVFAALADPTRRSILERLTRGPATVTELSEPYDMSLPAVSKHLRVLEAAGLLARQVDGRVHRIELSTGPLGDAMQWLERHHRFWSARLDALAHYLERRPKEEAPWQHPKSLRTPPSASSAGSRRRRPKSSKPGRKRTR